MASQRVLAFHLRGYACGVARRSRRMSTVLNGEEETRSPSARPAPKHDRTWNNTRGISFHHSSPSTGMSSQSLQIWSSESLLSTLSMQNRSPQAKRAITEHQPPIIRTRDAPAMSQPPQDLGYPELSLPEKPTQGKDFCPRLPDLPDTKHSNISGTSTSTRSQEGINCVASSSDEPFRTPLGFHIPKAKLQSALDATPSSPSAYWQYRLYQGPGGETDKVKVHYCKNKDDTEKVAQIFLDEDVIGFDIEWKSNAVAEDGIRKNVALVQIASERRVALFHIARYPNANVKDDFVAPSFKKLMESPNITKVGVAIKGDCTRLRTHLGITPCGLLELSHLYKLVKYSAGDIKNINKRLVSLADQVQEHLQLPLYKGEVRSSDWSQDLNHQQTQYAASDSYAGFHLFHVLEAKRKALIPTPPRPAHVEMNLPIRLADGCTVAMIDEATELNQASDISSNTSVEEVVRDIGKISMQYHSPDYSPARKENAASPLTSSSPGQPASPPPSPEVSLANRWVDRYKSSGSAQPTTTTASAKPAELRAYALWHEQGLGVPIIASLLRNPPLQNSTVASYVIKAILSDKLLYDSCRIEYLKQYVGAYGVPGVNWKGLK